MHKVLNISRRAFYYESQISSSSDELTVAIVVIYKGNYNNYGTRKIKVELRKLEFNNEVSI